MNEWASGWVTGQLNVWVIELVSVSVAGWMIGCVSRDELNDRDREKMLRLEQNSIRDHTLRAQQLATRDHSMEAEQ